MLDDDGNVVPPRKLRLKKVRTEFIRRRPDETSLMPEAPLNRHVTLCKILPVNATINVVEVDRKLHIGSDFTNFYFNPAKYTIEKDLDRNRSVTITLQQHNINGNVPTEYVVQRLKSYGDDSLSGFADKLRIYKDTYTRLINRYLEFASSNDSKGQQYLQGIKRKSQLFCSEVEKNQVFWKSVSFAGRDSFRNVSVSFSEGFLEKIGFPSIENFVKWSEKHGLISLFGSESSLMYSSIEGVFACTFFEENPARDLFKIKSYVLDKSGTKVEGVLHFLSSFEPVEDGFLYTLYILFNQTPSAKELLTVEEKRTINCKSI